MFSTILAPSMGTHSVESSGDPLNKGVSIEAFLRGSNWTMSYFVASSPYTGDSLKMMHQTKVMSHRTGLFK